MLEKSCQRSLPLWAATVLAFRTATPLASQASVGICETPLAQPNQNASLMPKPRNTVGASRFALAVSTAGAEEVEVALTLNRGSV